VALGASATGKGKKGKYLYCAAGQIDEDEVERDPAIFGGLIRPSWANSNGRTRVKGASGGGGAEEVGMWRRCGQGWPLGWRGDGGCSRDSLSTRSVLRRGGKGPPVGTFVWRGG
jgi:hypothetical protein